MSLLRVPPEYRLAFNIAHRQFGLAKTARRGISLDYSHDYVCLNFGGNLAAAMFARNHRCDVVGCSFQFSDFSGLDFVAKNSSLTIGNGAVRMRGFVRFSSR